MAGRKHTTSVQLIGDTDHSDFRDAVELLRAEARVVAPDEPSPELIVVAQSRPDTIGSDQLGAIRRNAPLAGIIALSGSWCEGETRTGRPWPGAHRLYWYEFPAWWWRQSSLLAAGRCPDWARPIDFGFRIADCGLSNYKRGTRRRSGGVINLQTPYRDTADALADTLQREGYSTVWCPPHRHLPVIRGAIAGVWDGGQLSEQESAELSKFCKQMSQNNAPVLALLDFPRRDRVDLALKLGASAVLGKPWLNSALTAVLEQVTTHSYAARAA